MLTLIQVSDCHFSRDPEARYRGESADRNLARLQVGIEAMAPDGLVLTGDISEDGSIESYRRVAEQVRGWAPLRAWLPGNHDDKTAMAEVFSAPDFLAGPVLDWGGWRLVLLDSAFGDRGDGRVDEDRLAPLDSVQEGATERPSLAFIHHQPMPIGAPWIDKYGMANSELLWQRLAGSRVRAIGFGHVHQAFMGERDGVVCLSAPSTVANSQAGTETFTPDPTGPKARWYRLHDDGRWQTGLISAGMN
jgi:Icc protein